MYRDVVMKQKFLRPILDKMPRPRALYIEKRAGSRLFYRFWQRNIGHRNFAKFKMSLFTNTEVIVQVQVR